MMHAVDPKVLSMRLSFVTKLTQTIESHCATTAIATLFPDVGGATHVELQRRHTQVIFSYGGVEAGAREWFISHALKHQPAQLVLRSLTTEIDPATQLRIKELHGYTIHQDQLFEIGADELARMWCGRGNVADVARVARVEAIRFC